MRKDESMNCYRKTNCKIGSVALIMVNLTLGLFLISCAGSQVPLSPPGDVHVDRKMIGEWIENNKKSERESDKMIVYQFNKSEYLIEYLAVDTDSTELLRFRAYTTLINDVLFANLQCVECDDDYDYTFYRYELTEDGILIIRPVKTKLYEDPLFNSSRELIDFITNNINEDEIYEKESHFRKLDY